MGKGMGKGGSWKATMDKINKVDPEKKAFISNLPEDTKWKDLMTLFTEGGHKPGLTETMSNGTGVVCFRDAAQAAAAIPALDQSTLNGQVIRVEAWKAKEKKAA